MPDVRASPATPFRLAIDPAALGTAAMAAVFALVVSPGPYGWLSTGAGIALLLLLAGYYRPLYLPSTGRIDALARAAAFGGIAGLLVGMALSWPIQAAVGMSACDIEGYNETACAYQVEAADWWISRVWLISGIVLAIGHRIFIRPPAGPTTSPPLCSEEPHSPPPSPPASAPSTHVPRSEPAPGVATPPQEVGSIVTNAGGPGGGLSGPPRSTVRERVDDDHE